MSNHKTCTKCGKEKEKSEFHRDKGTRDGRSYYCKACRSVARPKPAPNGPAPSEGMKWCYKCKDWKYLARFVKDERYKDGYIGDCKDCRNVENREWQKNNPEYAQRWRKNNFERSKQLQREWAKNNPEKLRAKQRKYYHLYREVRKLSTRKWQQANPEKVRLLSQITTAHYNARKHGAEGTFTAKEWLALCDYYGNKCLACGEQEPLTIDHVIPTSKGGRNDIANIQPLCVRCNSSKLQKTIDYRPTVPEWVKP